MLDHLGETVVAIVVLGAIAILVMLAADLIDPGDLVVDENPDPYDEEDSER